MKVLFFTRRFWPEIGGVEKHIMFLSKELVKRGFEITIISENQNHKLKDKEEVNPNIKIYRIPITTSEKNKKFQIWFWLLKNKKLIKEANIVHCHDVFFWFLPFKLLFPRKKVFTTFHGYEPPGPSLRKVFSHQIASTLSCGSIAIGDWHSKWYKVKSDIVSYGAVKESDSKKTLKRKYDFCFVGRLAKDTGILVYLKALKILNDKDLKYSLVVCGDGPESKNAKIFCKNAKLKVNFLGFIQDPIKYVNISKYCFVSSYLAILESLISKKFVFAVYDSPIKKDYLEMAPFSKWISISGSSQELAQNIEYYLSHPEETKKMIENGYEWAKKQTWGKLANQYISLWKK